MMEFVAPVVGTGALCECKHGSDLHELDAVALMGDLDSPDFGWRMRCSGYLIAKGADMTRAISRGALAHCGCTNLRLVA